MHVIDVVDRLPGNDYTVVHGCIDGHEDVILRHNPLPGTINQLHLTVYFQDLVCTWVYIN
jgi:hypothetical protein